MDKSYIGREEAFEIMLSRNIDKLPRKGKEVLTVHAIATGKPIDVLGKDEQGYYISEYDPTLTCQPDYPNKEKRYII